MIAYDIAPGYNPNFNNTDIWHRLKDFVSSLQKNPERIVAEVLRIEPNANVDLVTECAEAYRLPVADLTIQFFDERQVVTQLASGGGPGRSAKEACRRAVCRLVLEEMHRYKFEVCIYVN